MAKSDSTSPVGRGNYRHGMRHTSEYRTWQGMIQRCTNHKNPRYSDWGGRGIAVCDSWLASFLAFYEDMGPKPSPTHSIDRIDSNGNYEPGNCRWATTLEQGQNTSKSRLITYNGETHCISEWARRVGIERHTLAARMDHYGWSVEEAMTLPVSPIARCDRHP